MRGQRATWRRESFEGGVGSIRRRSTPCVGSGSRFTASERSIRKMQTHRKPRASSHQERTNACVWTPPHQHTTARQREGWIAPAGGERGGLVSPQGGNSLLLSRSPLSPKKPLSWSPLSPKVRGETNHARRARKCSDTLADAGRSSPVAVKVARTFGYSIDISWAKQRQGEWISGCYDETSYQTILAYPCLFFALKRFLPCYHLLPFATTP